MSARGGAVRVGLLFGGYPETVSVCADVCTDFSSASG